MVVGFFFSLNEAGELNIILPQIVIVNKASVLDIIKQISVNSYSAFIFNSIPFPPVSCFLLIDMQLQREKSVLTAYALSHYPN